MTYPKGEYVWTSYYNPSDELLFIVTSKPTRDVYFLYEVVDGAFKKIGKAKSPLELEEKFEIDDRIRKTRLENRRVL